MLPTNNEHGPCSIVPSSYKQQNDVFLIVLSNTIVDLELEHSDYVLKLDIMSSNLQLLSTMAQGQSFPAK
jgi:hypothetical protein